MRSEAYGIFRTLKRSLVRSSPEKLRGQIEQNGALEACGACAFRDGLCRSDPGAAHRLRTRGAPVDTHQPRAPGLASMYDGLYPLLREAIETGTFGRSVDVADGTRLLLTDEFFDFQHPTPQGAKRLSHLAAQRLGGWH